jgi:hypothetical protein
VPKTHRWFVKLPPRYRSKEAAVQIGCLENLTSGLLEDDIKGITPHELAWQSAPGHNTIGMLLAHLAIVETYWTMIGVDRVEVPDVKVHLGIGMDDDGMPLPPGAVPPAWLHGKTMRWYRGLFQKSRPYVVKSWARLKDAEMTKKIGRKRKNGDRVWTDPRWVLFHIVEHLAGHIGQILLIRHQYRDAHGKGR